MKSESSNIMKICNYSDPGLKGATVTWDFSNLKPIEDFTGHVTDNYEAVNTFAFPMANIELEEFNNKFYFKVAQDRIEQYGYRSKDNKVVVKFTKPPVKMTFPFTYGKEVTGDFNGLIFIGLDTGTLKGTYKIISDGYGTLVLPGEIVINNTLRVKYEKSYSQSFNTLTENIKIITYKWYCESYRYPLLVFTEIISATNKIYQAAYNISPGIPAIIESEITEYKSTENFVP